MSRAPKAIAGVPVPKRLRKPLDAAQRIVAHPLFTDTVAAALIAGAAALADNKGRREAAKAAGLGAAAAAVKASKGTNRLAIGVAVAVAELVVAQLASGKASDTAKRKKKRA